MGRDGEPGPARKPQALDAASPRTVARRKAGLGRAGRLGLTVRLPQGRPAHQHHQLRHQLRVWVRHLLHPRLHGPRAQGQHRGRGHGRWVGRPGPRRTVGPPRSCPCSSPGALGLSGLGAEVAKPPTRRTLPSLSLGIPGSAGPRARHRSFPSESSEAGQVAERPLCASPAPSA